MTYLRFVVLSVPHIPENTSGLVSILVSMLPYLHATRYAAMLPRGMQADVVHDIVRPTANWTDLTCVRNARIKLNVSRSALIYVKARTEYQPHHCSRLNEPTLFECHSPSGKFGKKFVVFCVFFSFFLWFLFSWVFLVFNHFLIVFSLSITRYDTLLYTRLFLLPYRAGFSFPR